MMRLALLCPAGHLPLKEADWTGRRLVRHTPASHKIRMWGALRLKVRLRVWPGGLFYPISPLEGEMSRSDRGNRALFARGPRSGLKGDSLRRA